MGATPSYHGTVAKTLLGILEVLFPVSHASNMIDVHSLVHTWCVPYLSALPTPVSLPFPTFIPHPDPFPLPLLTPSVPHSPPPSAFQAMGGSKAKRRERARLANLAAMDNEEEDIGTGADPKGDDSGVAELPSLEGAETEEELEAGEAAMEEEEGEEENPLLVSLEGEGEGGKGKRKVEEQWFSQDLFDGMDFLGEDLGGESEGVPGSKHSQAKERASDKKAGRDGSEPGKGMQGAGPAQAKKRKGAADAMLADTDVVAGGKKAKKSSASGRSDELMVPVGKAGGAAADAAAAPVGPAQKVATKGDAKELDSMDAKAAGKKQGRRNAEGGDGEGGEFEVVPAGWGEDSSSSGSDADSDDSDGGVRGRNGRRGRGGTGGFSGVGEDEEEEEEEEPYMDVEDKAITLALAHKMLRKKERERIIDDAYNRYTFDDDPKAVPRWFRDDEEKHMAAIKPITREEVEELKARFRAVNARPAKKVAEAKARKHRRMEKQLAVARSKATAIADQPDLNARSKARLMSKAYAQAAARGRPQKKEVVVAKKGLKGSRGRGVKNSVMVDKRMKKDLRAEKANDKRKGGGKVKGGGKGFKRKGMKPSMGNKGKRARK